MSVFGKTNHAIIRRGRDGWTGISYLTILNQEIKLILRRKRLPYGSKIDKVLVLNSVVDDSLPSNKQI